MKTGIYVRVSTEEQATEGFSIRAQQSKLKDYVRIKDWELYKVYSDEGISGKNIKERPAINQLIKDILDKKVNNVLVYKVDRLTRSTKDLIELVDIFNANDCAFNSLMESIDTYTASGRMFLKIIGIFAEFERENIVERVKLGFDKKVREGYSLCARTASYGYVRGSGVKVQEIMPEEAVIVKEIFSMYVDKQMTCHAIAKQLNIRNIQTKLNATWTSKTIHLILSNTNYIGKVRHLIMDEKNYHEEEGRHDGIISDELFQEAQDLMAKIVKKSRTKRPKEENYYCGTLVCGICGRKLATHGCYRKKADGTKVFFAQYRCINRMYSKCTASDVSHLKVDEAFESCLDNYENFNVTDDIDLEQIEPEENSSTILREEYEILVSRLAKKEKEIMTMYINEKLDFDKYTQMAKMIANEKEDYQRLLNDLSCEVSEQTIINKLDIITNFKENWKLLTKPEKMQFLRTYVKQIVVINEKVENSYFGKVKIKQIDFYE